jgi:hypothetical protein
MGKNSPNLVTLTVCAVSRSDKKQLFLLLEKSVCC